MLAEKKLSSEEVLQNVLSDERYLTEINKKRRVEADPGKAICSTIREIRDLRSRTHNFVAFEQEATSLLHGLFERWKETCPYSERIMNSTVTAGSLIVEEVSVWLKLIRRRLSARVKARNPWTMDFSRYLSSILFLKIKEVTSGSSTGFGIVVEQTVK